MHLCNYRAISSAAFLQFFLVVDLLAQPVYPDSTSLSLFEKEIHLTTIENRLSYTFPDSLLIPGSEQIRLDSVLLDHHINYEMNYLRGEMHLLQPVAAARLLTIQYRIFPFQLRKFYFHRKPVFARVQPTGGGRKPGAKVQPPPVSANRPSVASRLRKSGSIVRGVSVGSSQNLQVDSGLRLQVSGHLTKDVEIVASLTDQNTPIQPEGNTQTLQEIDKVFVQIKGPKMQATLGDYTLNLQGGRFTNYQRKQEGVMVAGDFKHTAFKVSAAVSRGQFTSKRFPGQEGKQGPYQLTGENGSIHILVLAGTEKVWVDGELMARGENYDYVIEYGNGQITFTRNRLITRDSRIVVDFQFSDESFQRSYLAAQGQASFANNKVQLKTTFIREGDDKDNPLSLNLRGDALAALATAGDSLAVIRGDTMVAAGQGSYLKNYIQNPTGDSTEIFVYVGPGNGNYRVSFSFVGAGKGDYSNLGLGRFEYKGKNLGDYLPQILLPAAKQHNIIGLNLNLAPTSFLQVKSELAISNFDQNLYSDRDDNNNSGTAYQLQIDLNTGAVKPGGIDLGRLDFSGKVRHKSNTFRDIGRSTIAEFGRRWNLADAPTLASEDILELAANYVLRPGLIVRTGIGRLQKAAAFHSNRWEITTKLDRTKLPKVEYFLEFINQKNKKILATSEWLRQKGRAEYSFKGLKPVFEFEGEIKKDAHADTILTGFRFESYTAGLEFKPWKSISTSVRVNFRDDKDRRGRQFFAKSQARTQTYILRVKKWRLLNLNASYIHREREFADEQIRDTRTDLADLRIGYRAASGWLRSNAFYQISNTQVARLEENFIKVADGEGNFSFNPDLNEFEPDPFGNYVKRFFTTNQFVPVIELKLRLDLRLAPAHFFQNKRRKKQPRSFLVKLLSPITTESFLRIDERTREKDVAKIYLLNLGAFQQDSTEFGSIEIRQDINLWQNSREMSWRYRYRNRMELNNQFVSGRRERRLREQQVRGKYRLSKQVSAQFEYIYSEEDKLFQKSVSRSREDRKVRSHQLQMDLVFRPRPQWELAAKTVFSFNKDLVPDPETEAVLLSLAPRAVYALSKKGRLQAEIDWTRVKVTPENNSIPFELTDGRRAGTSFRWNLAFEYRVSQNVRATFSYFGRSDPDRPKTQHIAKLEMRAFF